MARDVGAKNDDTLAREIGTAMASELRVLGFNLNFAPVADLAVRDVDVDGLTRDGDRVPVLRGGAWQL